MTQTLDTIRARVGAGLVRSGLARPLVLIKQTAGTSDNLGELTEPTLVRHNGHGSIRANVRNLDGTLVEVGQVICRVVASTLPGGIEPENGDRIEINNKTMEIQRVGFTNAGASYECVGVLK